MMLSITKKTKITILSVMMTASLLGTTFIYAAGPGGPGGLEGPGGPPPQHQMNPPDDRPGGPPPSHHHHHKDKDNTVTSFIAGAIVGAVVEHNA